MLLFIETIINGLVQSIQKDRNFLNELQNLDETTKVVSLLGASIYVEEEGPNLLHIYCGTIGFPKFDQYIEV